MKLSVKILMGAAGGAAGLFAAASGAYMACVLADAKRDFCDDCDYLLILGGNVFGADTPSPQLLERMKRAAAYLKEHPAVKAVPCGGCFRPGQKKSEAAIIGDYLTGQGIDPSRILPEERSTTTFENFRFGLPIIEKDSGKAVNDQRVAILSSGYHMHRAGIIAKRCGIKEVRRVSAPTPGEAFPRYLREYFVAYELLYHYK